MSTRRITRSVAKQQGVTLMDHFQQNRIRGSELPGKSHGDEAASPTNSAKRSLYSSSRVREVPNEVEFETLPVQTKKPETKSVSACALFTKKEIKKTPANCKDIKEPKETPHHGMNEFIRLMTREICLVKIQTPEKNAVSQSDAPLSPAKFADAPKPTNPLDRIRARNAAKAAAASRRNPELEEKMDDLVRLIDNKTRILMLIFDIYRTNSRTSMHTTTITQRMINSDRITGDKVPSLLERLTDLVPHHFSMTETHLGKFIKVAPDNSPMTFTAVESILRKELEECQAQYVAHARQAL